MGDTADEHPPEGRRLPWDLPDQIDEVERQVARQARKYRQMRAAIDQAESLFGRCSGPGADA